MEAVILAGGQGTRLRSVVPDLPKPMAPVGGRPFLEHQMDYWIAQGVRRFVLSVGYKHDVIRSHFGSRYNGAEVDYAVEETSLGTGGGLLLALERVTNATRVLVLNGDTYFAVQLAAMRDFHEARGASMTMALRVEAENTRYGGVAVNEVGCVLGFTPKPQAPSRALINGGVYLINPAALDEVAARPQKSVSLEEEIIPHLLHRGGAFGFEAQGQFIDIGIPEDYFRAESVLTASRVHA